MKQIQEKSTVANDNLEDATNSTRAMRQGNKRAAQDALVDLKNDYRRLMLSSSVFILSTGPHAVSLGELATSETQAFSLDSKDLYRKIASKIDSRAYLNMVVTSSIMNNVSNALEEVAKEIGVREYAHMHFKSEYSRMISSQEDFVDLIKQIVNDGPGSEMVGIYAINTILEQALERGHSEGFTPIILTTTDDQLAVTLSKDLKRLSPNVYVVSVGKASKTIKGLPNSVSIKEASKEALEQLLQEIKSKTV